MSGTETAGHDNLPDRKLAARVSRGDERAFDEFYGRFAGKLYSLAVRLSANGATAEDMTQEVFLHLLRKLDRFDGRAALSTWIYRVALNFFISYLRRNRQAAAQPSLDELIERDSASLAGPGQVEPFDRLDLEHGLAALPAGYRQVLVLHDVEGHRHEEIAEILGISVGTSKSQLHHARMKLRGLLQGVAP